MKKLLVILMLGAGFVTVASAEVSLDCTTDTTHNKCCVDVASIQSAIQQAPHNVIFTPDNDMLFKVGTSLVNDADGTDPNLACVDTFVSAQHGNWSANEVFMWQPGSWTNSIMLDPND